MFTSFESKPIQRLAHKVVESDIIDSVEGEESTSILTTTSSSVSFKHYEPVKLGDYIVYLTDKDIYHCDADVFAERNHV